MLERYLEVFAVADAGRLRSEWISMTALGSLARLYSEHQTTLRQAMEDGGAAPPREDTVEATGEGVQICTGASLCLTYTRPVSEDGLLTDFTVNDEPLAGHVVQPGAQAAAAGVTVRVVSGHETSRRALFLCVEADNASGAPVWLEAATAAYPGPDGFLAPAAMVHGPGCPVAARRQRRRLSRLRRRSARRAPTRGRHLGLACGHEDARAAGRRARLSATSWHPQHQGAVDTTMSSAG